MQFGPTDDVFLTCSRCGGGVLSGLLCDLLWSDPDKDITGWSENDRGVSFTFGPDVVSRFLQKHDMDLICRAHQVCLLFTTSLFAFGFADHGFSLTPRSSRMAMNSSQNDTLLPYSQRLITVANSIMLEQ